MGVSSKSGRAAGAGRCTGREARHRSCVQQSDLLSPLAMSQESIQLNTWEGLATEEECDDMLVSVVCLVECIAIHIKHCEHSHSHVVYLPCCTGLAGVLAGGQGAQQGM